MIAGIDGEGGGLMLPSNLDDSLANFPNVVRTLLFRVFSQYQSSIKKSKSQVTVRVWFQLFFIPIQTAQLLSLLLVQLKETEDYAEYEAVEQGLTVVRPDRWVAGWEEGVCIAVGVWVVLQFALLSYQLVHSYLSPQIRFHPALLACFSLPLAFIHKYLWVPLLLFLLSQTSESLLSAQQSLWLGVVSLLELLFTIGFLLLYMSFFPPDAYSLCKEQMLSRPDPAAEILEFLVLSGFCIVSRVQVTGVLSVTGYIALGTYLVIYLTWKLPYYNLVCVVGKVLQFTLTTWSSLSVLFGLLTHSCSVSIKLFLFISPCVCFLLYHLLLYRKGLLSYHKSNISLWKFELMLRNILDSVHNEVTLAEVFAFGTRLFGYKHRRFYLLEGQYYYYVKTLPEMALVRLTLSMRCPQHFMAEYQVHRFEEALYRVSNSEEREFIAYEGQFQHCRQLDYRLCEATYDLLSSITNKSNTGKVLERAVLYLAELVYQTNSSYRELKQRFPTDPYVLETYGTYLSDLFHQAEAIDLKTRGSLERNRLKKAHINVIEAYSSEDTGVMIVSCHPEWFGKVVFANGQMGGVLGGKIQDIVGKDLDDFIPPPFNFNHNLKLQSFLLHGEAKEISRSHLYLTSLTHYSIEVTFRFRPTVLSGVPYFLVAVREKPKTREFALYGSDGKVTSHSQGFPHNLGLPRKWVIGESLETLFPGLPFLLSPSEAPFTYTHPLTKSVFCLKFSSVPLGNSFITSLYILTGTQGIDDLFHSTSGIAVSQIRKTLKSVDLRSQIDSTRDTSINPAVSPLNTPDSPLLKDLRDTKDEFTGATTTSTSFARGKTGINMRKTALKASRRLKLSLLILILVVILLLSAVITVIWMTLQEVMNGNEENLGDVRLHFVKITHVARRLELIQSGLGDASQRQSLQSSLESEVSALNSAIFWLDSSVTVRVISRLNGKFTASSLPLKTALTDFSTHALLQTSSEVSAASDEFYTYYNGLGELLRVVNSTVESSQGQIREWGWSVVQATAGVAGLVVSLGMLSTCVVLLRSLKSVYECYCGLWKVLVSIPTSKARDIMTVHKTRIEVLHGLEHAAPEQKKSKENRSMMKPPVRWAVILSKSSLLLLFTCAFTVFLGVYSQHQLETLLWTNTQYIHSVSYLTILPTLTLHTLKEMALWEINSNEAYFALVPEAQTIPSLSLLLSNYLSSLSSLETTLLWDLDSLSDHSKPATLSLSTACPYLNSTGCEGSALERGEIYAGRDWMFRLMDLQRKAEEGESVWKELEALETSMDMLTEALIALQSDLQSYSSSACTQFASELLTYSCIFILLCAGIYALLYLPVVEDLQSKCMAVWRVTTLVRSDYVSGKTE